MEAELDEMWGFVKSKKEQRWLWHAIDHKTGEILAYVLSGHKDEAFLGRVINQQFQIQNVVQDTKVLKCLRSRGFVSICGISVMLYLVIDQVCLQVADSPRG